MDTDKENIKLILERSENPESVDSLENAIINLGYEPNDKCKYEWLEALETKPDFFKLIAEWGGLKKTAELLEYLFESERVYRRGNKQDAIDSNGVPMLSSFGRITRGVLEYVPDIIKFDGFEHGGNILHAVCDNGVGSIAEVVIETLDEFEPGLVQDLLQQYDSRERRPTTLAVNGKDISVLRLMALYDDGKRHEHVLEAVKKGELDYLKVLLEEREDVDDLLKGSVYESAAGAGNMGVWIFLAEKYPARAKTQQNLRSAVEKRRGKIVRYILEHYPEVLNEQEELLKTTQKAVKLSKKKEITTDGYNARRELSKDQKLSMEIEDLILDKMVRHLDPTVVKACWPSDDG
ncbi:hypothetical protein GGR58DRAFT_308991 [Xylaria digitata]|nr:hypothetical protein GGR58DRAFT_308991 [Xylaria digitata]